MVRPEDPWAGLLCSAKLALNVRIALLRRSAKLQVGSWEVIGSQTLHEYLYRCTNEVRSGIALK
jgi:hypothetical protein